MEQNNILAILWLSLRVVGAIVCNKQAKQLNRDTTGWSIFGFFLPVIAMIWINCLDYLPDNNSAPAKPKPFTNYYTDNGVIKVENEGEKRVFINDLSAPNGLYELNRFETIEVLDGKIKSNNNSDENNK